MIKRSPAALLLTVLFALAPILPAEAAWSRPRRLGISRGDETALAVAGQTVHAVWYGICSPSSNFGICYGRSTDCGESWSEPAQLAESFTTGALDLAASGQGVHLVWTKERSVFYSGSHDRGKSWSKPQALSPGGLWAEARSIDALGPEVYVSFLQGGGARQGLRRARAVVAVSLDGGRSWKSKNAMPRLSGLRTPLLALGPGATAAKPRLHLVSALSAREILYQLSDDRGTRWTAPLLINSGTLVEPEAIATLGGGVHVLWRDGLVFHNGSIGGAFQLTGRPLGVPQERGVTIAFGGALAGAQTVLHAAWQEEHNLRYAIYSARSYDRGRTWSRPKRLAPDAELVSLAIAVPDAVAGSCNGSSHVIYGREHRSRPGQRATFYRRRPRSLDQ